MNVSGWRKSRKDTFLNRRLPSMLANALISKITGVPLHDYGCTLKAYRREVVRDINLYGEMHRFIPALARWVGARIEEVSAKTTSGLDKWIDWLLIELAVHRSALKSASAA